jgi:hypothetical protein
MNACIDIGIIIRDHEGYVLTLWSTSTTTKSTIYIYWSQLRQKQWQHCTPQILVVIWRLQKNHTRGRWMWRGL